MKKSYDYFKTLKLLSESASVIYEKALLKQDFSSDRIHFLAEKSELINNLLKDFITPFERGDIFLLEESLTEEVVSICSFQELLNLCENDCDAFKRLAYSLEKQNKFFSQLRNYKSNLKLFEQCSEEIRFLNSEKRLVEGLVADALNCISEQPLVKYVVCSAFLDLNRKVYNTILQIERILIDNS